jgi:hypothetical protein
MLNSFRSPSPYRKIYTVSLENFQMFLPADEDARAQHLVGLRRGGLVPGLVLAVGHDAVVHLHAQRAVSERGRVGAAERARPQGVGMDPFGELEVFVREAIHEHTVHPQAVTYGLMGRDSVHLLKPLAACMQYASEKLFSYYVPRKQVRDFVASGRRASIRKTSKHFPKSRVARDTRP